MREKIFSKLQEFLSKLLGIDKEKIYLDESFFQLGIDSVMMMTVVKEINDLFKVDLSLSDITFKYNTFGLICDYIAEKSVEDEGKKEDISPVKDTCEEKQYKEVQVQEQAKEQIQEELCMDSLEECNAYKFKYMYNICREQRQTLEKIFMRQLELFNDIGNIKQQSSQKVINNKEEFVKKNLGNIDSFEDKKVPKIESATDSNISISMENPLTEKQNEMLNKLIENLVKKTAKSKALAADYRKYLADLDEVAGFTMLLKEIHYQISIESGNGSEIIDVDGNHYVDIAMGFGTLILGHSPEFVMKSLEKEISRGMQLAPRHRLVGEVAKLVCELTEFDRATFTVTGTEAVMTAMKFARAYSRKNKIGVFSGCYHGHNDATLITKMSKNDKGRPLAPGVSKASLDDMILFDYNDMASIEEIAKHKDELAAVIIEPVQSRRPGIQPVEFLKAVRKVTEENNILLIFDEVITGFRCNTGGAKKYFGIEPDMATYGKAACNGMPIGIVAGKAEVMDVADGGIWQYGDDSYPVVEQTFYAGTFFKHPFTMAAAYEILSFYKKDNNKMQNRLAKKTSELVKRLNIVFKEYNVPIEVNNFTSLFKFTALDDSAFIDIFYYKLLEYGIFTWEGRTCFLSDAHTDEDINKIVEATISAVKDMKEAGFYVKDNFKKGLPNELFYD